MNNVNNSLVSTTIVQLLEQAGSFYGAAFFERILSLLAPALHADGVFIAQVTYTDNDVSATGNANTLCVHHRGHVVDNFTYSLAGTPCQRVVGQHTCVHFSSVSESFPASHWLLAMDIEGYVGVPLRDTDGQVIGLWGALYASEPVNAAVAESLLSLLGGQVAAQLMAHKQYQSLESELVKSRQLQDQYQILARHEREAKHRAHKTNRVKGTFLTHMSQEIKTPMNAMLAFCQMLLKSGLPLEQPLQLQAMMDFGQQLMAMLNDVMELSRLEEGYVVLEEDCFASHLLFDNVIEQANSQLQNKPVVLHFGIEASVPPQIILAEFHVQKVVASLLDNAMKWTLNGDIYVNVSFVAELPETGTLVITVADTSDGLDAIEIENIFEPFYQPKALASQNANTGLDLYVAERLVKAMAGTINVHSQQQDGQQGSGSVFRVRIPVAQEQGPRVLASDVKVAVLCLDKTSNAVEQNLRFLGAKCVRFDARVPLALQLAQYPVAGVIVDAAGEQDGFEVLAQIVSDLKHEKVPFVIAASKQLYVEALFVGGSLSGCRHALSPVLMHEWLSIVDGFKSSVMADASDTLAVKSGVGERILLVEDNRLNQEIAVCILEDAGYSVDIANNGQEAVDQMTATPNAYRLVLMDIQMPVMDGLEATRVIRGRLHNTVPIVAITAGLAVQDRQLCDDAGMNDFIPKPINEAFVLQKVRYYTSGMHHL